MRDLVSKQVDGCTYEFQQLGAKKALKILIRISKIVGEPLALAFASAEGPGKFSEKKVNPAMLSQAVKSLMEKVTEDEGLEIIETLTGESACVCDGKKVSFDSHYEGKLPHLFKVLKAALEVQYGNFFDVLSDLPGMSRLDSTPESVTST